MCGYVAAPGTESDFLTFTLKPATTKLEIQYSGNITIKFTVEGKPSVTWDAPNFPDFGFVQGKPYSLEIKAKTAAKADWTVTLIESTP